MTAELHKRLREVDPLFGVRTLPRLPAHCFPKHKRAHHSVSHLAPPALPSPLARFAIKSRARNDVERSRLQHGAKCEVFQAAVCHHDCNFVSWLVLEEKGGGSEQSHNMNSAATAGESKDECAVWRVASVFAASIAVPGM